VWQDGEDDNHQWPGNRANLLAEGALMSYALLEADSGTWRVSPMSSNIGAVVVRS
jgi:hypothetical protein